MLEILKKINMIPQLIIPAKILKKREISSSYKKLLQERTGKTLWN